MPRPTLRRTIPVSELGLPLKGRRTLHFGVDQSSHDISRMHIYRTDRHDLLAILFVQFAQKQVNQRTQLIDLEEE